MVACLAFFHMLMAFMGPARHVLDLLGVGAL